MILKAFSTERLLISHTETMKKYKDKEGKTVVETEELSFLTDHGHSYGWLRCHFHHHRLRLALKKADHVIVPDAETAENLHRFYFIPREIIHVKSSITHFHG